MARGSALAGAAGLAGFASAISRPATSGPTGANAGGYGAPARPESPIAQVAAVPSGGGLVLSDLGVVLLHLPDGRIAGYSAVCTHQGCLVSSVRAGRISCPCHGSIFDAASGAVLEGPAPSPLPPVAVTVRDGQVFRTGGAS
jgi:Rieske Fe-S protein